MTTALPPVVDRDTWKQQLDQLRVREKAATRELDAIAAQRRRLPMVKMPEYTLVGKDGPVRLVDVIEGKSQLITYHHMWTAGAEWQCPGCGRAVLPAPNPLRAECRPGGRKRRSWHHRSR